MKYTPPFVFIRVPCTKMMGEGGPYYSIYSVDDLIECDPRNGFYDDLVNAIAAGTAVLSVEIEGVAYPDYGSLKRRWLELGGRHEASASAVSDDR